MDDLLTEFLTETNESLATLDVEIVKLEQNPNDPELLSNIFRLVHTIKGTCGFLGLPRLEAVAHASENVLGKFRDGEMSVSPVAVTLILSALDRIKEILAVLEDTEQEPEGSDEDLISQLDVLAEGGDVDAPVEAAPPPAEAPAADVADAGEAPQESAAPAPSEDGSVFDRIGGILTLEGAVDFSLEALTSGGETAKVFAGADMDHYAGALKAVLTKLLGGPDHTDGSFAEMQAQLVANGFDGAVFDRMVELLLQNILALGNEQAAADQAAGEITQARDEFLKEQAADAAAPAEQPAEEPAEKPAAAAQPAPAANVPATEPSGETPPAKESSVAAQTIRVNVDVLENLMTMVSELVLTRNQLLQILRSQQESEFASPLQRLSHVTTELQEGVMKTRMQPIGNAWSKLPRIIRDLSVELNKKIELQMIGAETELDRQVLELIRDPLTHMIRNSADHGLEGPAERLDAGKPETGTIKLRAFHEGGHIIIEIADDGRGINIERVKAKAVENGLATEAELEGMSEQQVAQFIFKAGFSTAANVTSVSGRGVGMDVVRTNIEKIGGTVELTSNVGKGSTFTIKIPLTLAIVSALIVESGGERFAIPQLSVVELVRASSNSEHTIEWIRETPVLRLRNRLLPLVSLREMLKLEKLGGNVLQLVDARTEQAKAIAPPESTDTEAPADGLGNGHDAGEDALAAAEAVAAASADAADAPADVDLEALAKLAAEHPDLSHDELIAKLSASPSNDADTTVDEPAGGGIEASELEEHFIVVTQVGNYSFGIIVDRVFDTEEIVVKPVAPILRHVSMFSGNTILGDGSVIMILDPNGIAAAAGDMQISDKSSTEMLEAKGSRTDGETVTLLLFRAGSDTPKAVPLALVARLEEIDLAKVEWTSGQPMVQYRGRLMPLVPIDQASRVPDDGSKPILVFTDQERSMGLVVDEIVDIVEDQMTVEFSADQHGLMGSAIIAEKATDVIDAGHYLEQAFADWFKTTDVAANGNGANHRVLLVDDSPFFRNLLTPLLSVAGYEVTSVDSAQGALDLLDRGDAFDAIISDIEMPQMDGFGFAEAVRAHERWGSVPLIALSSRTAPQDVDRGREVGFTDYVAKSDRDALLLTLSQILSQPGTDEAAGSTADHAGAAA